MKFIKALVTKTNSDEVQSILASLNAYDDVLLLSDDSGKLEVNYLSDTGKTVKLGEIPASVSDRIVSLCDGEPIVDICDFGIYKRNNGKYRLWVGLEVLTRRKRYPVKPSDVLCMSILISTMIFASAAAVIRIFTLYRKNVL